ncbi:hypothetical protein HI914_01735 [Erysiphe necator]|nr:hypothetical protein HI914_01735 [Erysiphe necator]
MPAESKASSSIAHIAADRLWQFQLRKENKAILDELKDHDKKRISLLETNQNRFEAGEDRILKLEAKITQLEQEHNKKMQAWEKFKNEQRAQTTELKLQIFMHATETLKLDEICKIMKERVSMTTSENQDMTSSRNLISGNKNSNIRHLRSHCQTINEDGRSQVAELGKRPGFKEKNIVKKPEVRTEKKSIKQNLFIPRPKNGAEESKLPKLSQGRVRLRLYYQQADSICSSSMSSTEQFETEFVNSFIKGISNYKAREKFIAHLQQIYPSKQKKDGRVEILCSWAELGEAIKTFGALGEKNSVCKSKKQRCIPSKDPVKT